MENEDEKWERGLENQIHDNSSGYHLKGEAVLKISPPPKEILESYKSGLITFQIVFALVVFFFLVACHSNF